MSVFFTSRAGVEIYLNLSKEHRSEEGKPHLSVDARQAVKALDALSANGQAKAEHLVAADTIFDEGVCVSPFWIFKRPLHRRVCEHINEVSQFTSSLRQELDAVKTFAFIDNAKVRTTYQSVVERVLAVFSFSAAGLIEADDAPLEFIHAVVDFFRSDDGMDWNPCILGTDPVPIQCVSNIIIGLAKVYDDDSLLEKARKHRSLSKKQNPSWFSFQFSSNPIDQELQEHYKGFIEDERTAPGAAQSAVLSISSWLKEMPLYGSLSEVVTSSSRTESLSAYLKRRNDNQASRTTLSILEAARKFSRYVSDHLAVRVRGQTMFDLVTAREVTKLRNEVKKLPKADSARARPLPEKMVPILREILEEGVNGWPGKSGLFNVEVDWKGKKLTIYCPVIVTLFLVMLDLPLRMGQVRRLDSGEADLFQFNGELMNWEENTGPHAGYWAREVGQGRYRTDTRGYAREIHDEIRPVTGIFVNTNKTGKPYVIPWSISSLFKNLWALRQWQEKYNPISEPIGPELYLSDRQKYPLKTLQEMPRIFPIARLLPNKYWPHPGRVATSSEINLAWGNLLLEVQRRWNEQHPGNQVLLAEIHPKNGQPHKHRYTIHGLRVRGLTNLRRGGMPLDLLSRFVAGHASVRMTMYYTKPNPNEIAEHIEKAIAAADSQRDFINDLRAMSVDEALRRSVALSPTAVSEAINSGAQAQFCNVSLGVCPFDGARCYDGGKLLQKEVKNGVSRNVYGDIKNRNCVICRHFITGAPWLNQLLDYGTKLCARRQFLARDEERLLHERDRYEQAFKAGEITGALWDNKYDELQADVIQVKEDWEINENSVFEVERLCTAIKKLVDSEQAADGKVLLVAQESAVEYREISEFKQAAWITAMGRIHRILGDDQVEAKRDQYLDFILANSGIRPVGLMSGVSLAHRKKALDQYALYLDATVAAEDVDDLVNGHLRLQDLRIHEQVRNLIEVSLYEPVLLPEIDRRAKLLTSERH